MKIAVDSISTLGPLVGFVLQYQQATETVKGFCCLTRDSLRQVELVLVDTYLLNSQTLENIVQVRSRVGFGPLLCVKFHYYLLAMSQNICFI